MKATIRISAPQWVQRGQSAESLQIRHALCGHGPVRGCPVTLTRVSAALTRAFPLSTIPVLRQRALLTVAELS
jgi:hypothetical protein